MVCWKAVWQRQVGYASPMGTEVCPLMPSLKDRKE